MYKNNKNQLRQSAYVTSKEGINQKSNKNFYSGVNNESFKIQSDQNFQQMNRNFNNLHIKETNKERIEILEKKLNVLTLENKGIIKQQKMLNEELSDKFKDFSILEKKNIEKNKIFNEKSKKYDEFMVNYKKEMDLHINLSKQNEKMEDMINENHENLPIWEQILNNLEEKFKTIKNSDEKILKLNQINEKNENLVILIEKMQIEEKNGMEKLNDIFLKLEKNEEDYAEAIIDNINSKDKKK